MSLVNFCGLSGRSYSFEKMNADDDWPRRKGIAIFTASGAFGWRVVRIVELDGRPDNVQPIWAFRDAQRYGAHTVFFAECAPILDRKTKIADLRDGLAPVCDSREVATAA